MESTRKDKVMRIVADNLTVTHPGIAAAIRDFDPGPVRELVRACVSAGAEAIDVNPGPLSREPEERMRFLVETVQAVTDLPLLLDTANPRALAAGLKACRRPPVLNGFSLEPAKLTEILPLAREAGTDIVGYLLYPDSRVPSDAAGRLSLAVDLFSAFTDAGIDPDRLVIDPVIVPVAWENGITQARDVLEVVSRLPDLLGYPVRTIAGLSNLTSGRGGTPERRRALEGAYVAMLAGAGLTQVLLNVLRPESVLAVRAARTLLRTGVFAWDAV